MFACVSQVKLNNQVGLVPDNFMTLLPAAPPPTKSAHSSKPPPPLPTNDTKPPPPQPSREVGGGTCIYDIDDIIPVLLVIRISGHCYVQ